MMLWHGSVCSALFVWQCLYTALLGIAAFVLRLLFKQRLFRVADQAAKLANMGGRRLRNIILQGIEKFGVDENSIDMKKDGQ